MMGAHNMKCYTPMKKAKGGFVPFTKKGSAKHDDAAMDKKLVKAEVGKAMKKGYATGGSVARGMGVAIKGGKYTIC